MTCDGCVKDISGALHKLQGITKVEANLDDQLVSIEGTGTESQPTPWRDMPRVKGQGEGVGGALAILPGRCSPGSGAEPEKAVLLTMKNIWQQRRLQPSWKPYSLPAEMQS